jgi:phosphinothricin acetyltransferase
MKYSLRTAAVGDAELLRDIYAPYVSGTAITFECEIPAVEEFRRRIAATLERYPYLVAEDERGDVVGYAYAGPLKERAAFGRSVETSIYVRQDEVGKGLGRLLHDALEQALKDIGILNMYACIAAPRGDDPYLTDNSIRFHTHLGYRLIGRFLQCGYKFNRWYDMVWMEKLIGEHRSDS